MQGTVFAPLQATTSMSQLGRMAYRRGKPLLTYKDTVNIPALGMIDDVATVSKCGIDSVISNSITNTFIESKRLELGEKKSHRIHIGKQNENCAKSVKNPKRITNSSKAGHVASEHPIVL